MVYLMFFSNLFNVNGNKYLFSFLTEKFTKGTLSFLKVLSEEIQSMSRREFSGLQFTNTVPKFLQSAIAQHGVKKNSYLIKKFVQEDNNDNDNDNDNNDNSNDEETEQKSGFV